MNMNRDIDGKILFATISKTRSGQFYASITCEVEHTPYPKTGKHIGIDTGIKDLAILSDGTKYENPKFLKKEIKKVKYLSRQLSKKNKGSSSRKKAICKLAIEYEKLSNKRMDYLHKVSTEIVKNHDFISVEDLAVKNLMKNHHLAQSFSDVALGSFYSMLEYKCKWNDREFVKIGRFFPSSKCCSNCGWINQDLTLKIREWTCPNCGFSHDRDINASRNILIQGLNLSSGCGTQSDVKQKQGEACLLDQSVNPETKSITYGVDG
jgi:putative transposase